MISLKVLRFGNILAAALFILEYCYNPSGYYCFNAAAALVALNHKLTT